MERPEFESFLAEVARIALAANDGSSIALAGSGALRAHYLTSRPTEDIDLFFIQKEKAQAQLFFDNIEKALREHGYDVKRERSFSAYALFSVYQGDLSAAIDVGIDYREHEPVLLAVGPVLHKDDAVGNKVAALFSRIKIRDYLDVQAIRDSGSYTDDELLELGAARDLGFTRELFGRALLQMPPFDEAVKRYSLGAYDCTPEQYARIRKALTDWGERILAKADLVKGQSLIKNMQSTPITAESLKNTKSDRHKITGLESRKNKTTKKGKTL